MFETNSPSLPRWIVIYAVVVMIITSLALAVVLLVSPRTLLPELSGTLVFGGPQGLLGLHVARYFAFAMATSFALYRRSASMMLLMFMIRLLTDVPDYTISVISGDYQFPFVILLILIYWVPTVWGCSYALVSRSLC